ncbi:MAG: FAD-dependent oxidoreductase [Planctomycetaceae bacterium]
MHKNREQGIVFAALISATIAVCGYGAVADDPESGVNVARTVSPAIKSAIDRSDFDGSTRDVTKLTIGRERRHFELCSRPARVSSNATVHDLLVYGSTPGGIACAVRAAREGMNVVLVTHAEHLGGLLTSGLSTMDTLYNGDRAPLYDELRASIHSYYRDAYGADSENYRRSMPRYAKTKFEAHVVERILTEMLTKESRIEVIRRFFPAEVLIQGRNIEQVRFRSMHGTEEITVSAATIADCSYEGDLAALAVPCRTGRESREQFQESHAGRIFMRSVPWPPAHIDPEYLAEYRRMNLVHYDNWYEIVETPGSGASDPHVQAYNLRTLLTNDPANRIPVTRPNNYDREQLVHDLETRVNWSHRTPGTKLPNQKTYWNLPEVLGVQTDYVTGDWNVRKRVWTAHAELTLGLLYFLQNDDSLPEEVRREWQQWGLPKDEFQDNHHLPYEIYMRETRRLVGRAVFTEQDALPAAGMKRAPIHVDAIGITEWFLDSHACTPEKVPGSHWEGELLLKNVTVPGQISWQTLLSPDLDNLVVPVCVSSSHIGWGAIRLEPTWMAIGEAAAWGAIEAGRGNCSVAEIHIAVLQKRLAEQRIMLSFFNDVEQHAGANWYAAVQYLGTQGYFGSYDAQPTKTLEVSLAQAWSNHTAALLRHEITDFSESARAHYQAETANLRPVSAGEFVSMLDDACGGPSCEQLLSDLGIVPKEPIRRGNACRLLYSILSQSANGAFEPP